jgi:hypothetical protein
MKPGGTTTVHNIEWHPYLLPMWLATLLNLKKYLKEASLFLYVYNYLGDCGESCESLGKITNIIQVWTAVHVLLLINRMSALPSFKVSVSRDFSGPFLACMDGSRSEKEPLTVFNFSVEPLILATRF